MADMGTSQHLGEMERMDAYIERTIRTEQKEVKEARMKKRRQGIGKRRLGIDKGM